VLVSAFLSLYAIQESVSIENKLGQEWVGFFPAAFVTMGLSLFVVTPLAYINFRSLTARERYLGFYAWMVAASTPVMATCLLFNTEIGYFCVGVITCVALVLLAFWSMRASGFHLTKFADKAANLVVSLSEERAIRFQTRLLISLFVLSTLATRLCANSIQVARLHAETAARDLNRTLFKTGGHVLTYNYEVSDVNLGADATDAMVSRILIYKDLQELSLANSMITDNGVALLSSLSRLRELDLSGTRLSIQGLTNIPGQVNSISLARTNLPFDDLVEFLRSRQFNSIDLSGLNIDDERLIDLVDSGALGGANQLRSLMLTDNPITDRGVSYLMNGRRLSHLNLSRTHADGSGLPLGSVTSLLELGGTRVSDEILRSLIVQGLRVSIRSTAVSGKLFQGLPAWNGGLTLSDCNISEIELENLPKTEFVMLALHDKKYTGLAFKNGNIAAQFLDLSWSGITDDDIHHLAKVDGLQFLKLEGTAVTDRSLPFLENLNLRGLYLRETRITVDGLISSRFPKSHVFLSSNDFGEDDLKRLGKVHKILIDNSFWPR
ncbi:MAG: hypothetical protein ABL921_29210, partial [Pirellula sp.]